MYFIVHRLDSCRNFVNFNVIDMKLFDDTKLTKAHQTCENIKNMCRESIARDNQDNKRVAVRSIKRVINN